MLGHRTKRFKLFNASNLDALVPADHFYRQLEEKLDLSFVRAMVRDHYEEIGHPSIDPVVFFKLHLIAFFERIASERQLMETAHLNLAHRWYLGYDLDDALPDHSSLSKIRSRYGVEAFQRFFEAVLSAARKRVWWMEPSFISTRRRSKPTRRWARWCRAWRLDPSASTCSSSLPKILSRTKRLTTRMTHLKPTAIPLGYHLMDHPQRILRKANRQRSCPT
jgi:transposase